MIESQTIAGPIAVARALAVPPAAELPAPPRPDPFPRLDPSAPFGPAPTFKVTYLDRVWEDLTWPGPRPPGPHHAFGGPARNGGDGPGVDLRV